MKRRTFLKSALISAATCGGAKASPTSRQAAKPVESIIPRPVRPVTHGPKHHFFGYYDKCPWDKTGRYLLAAEIDFIGRDPQPGEAITLGRVDLQRDNAFIPFDSTLAWSWQQGTMLQWLGSAPDREVIYNSLQDDHYVSIIRDLNSGETRTLPRPVCGVSRDGTKAVCLDYERVNRLRPGYGYVALPERSATDPAPKDAGIYLMDLATGKNKLVLSLDWVAHNQPLPEFDGAHHWFNHLEFNPSGKRFTFLHRWRTLSTMRFSTRFYSADIDGGNVRLHADLTGFSHYDWRDDETILVWAATKEKGHHFYLLDDRTGRWQVVADRVLTRDGHCSYSPDRQWVLVDTYPDEQRRQHLMLYKPAENRLVEIAALQANPEVKGAFRCDLHPRWNRDGTQVCIDSSHEPTRQVYVLDVRDITV